MRRWPLAVCLLAGSSLLGCDKEANGPGPGATLLLGDYLGLDEGAGWTFRDDGSDEDPDEASLLRVRLVDEETLGFVRGARWADGADAGELAFDTRYGLSLVAYELDGRVGEGDWLLADFDPVAGEAVGSDGWSCTVASETSVETWYATFEDAVVVECSGSDGLPGRWALARGIGLVQYAHPDGYLLDLVAPY